MGKVAKLVMVTEANNNKYYNMEEMPNGTIKIVRGRIESSSVEEKPVPMSKWNSLYNSKVKKGYVDQTHLFAEEEQPKADGQKDSSPSFADIMDPTISKFIGQLQTWANKTVEQNYTISTSKVTAKQIDSAQTILDELSHLVTIGVSLSDINQMLLNLFKTLPRKMSHVQDHLFHVVNDQHSLDEAMKLLAHEQDLLDVFKGQVQVYAAQQAQTITSDKEAKKKQTLLEAMGIEFFNTVDSEKELILSKIQDNNHKKLFKQAFRVNNKKTLARFQEFVAKAPNKKTELFWHGSRNQNWWSILDSGLVLRPTNAIISGKMFGYGTYFADKFQKSLGYTSYSGSRWAGGNSDTAILSLYDVHVGNQYEIKKWNHEHSQLVESKLKALGAYDSVYAHGGYDLVNNEFIVYNEAQTTVKFITQIGGR